MPVRVVIQYPASLVGVGEVIGKLVRGIPQLAAAMAQEDAMPSKSKAQARIMQAAAHNPAFAKKVGVPQSVAQDYAQADAKRGTKRLPARKK